MRASRSFDVLVVGAGPAGLAAACRAAEGGRSVAVVDDNPNLGGQIWRRERGHRARGETRVWLRRVRRARVERLAGTQVVGAAGPGALLAETAGTAVELRYHRLILATGARELFLPFPGWCLPGVVGAGGLQALVKSGLSVRGKRVLVAGSGPLLLAVAAYLVKHGADVPLIAEQAPRRRVLRFGLGLWREPGKLLQGLALRFRLRGARYLADCWPTAAEGDGALSAVSLTDGGRTWKERCDYLACGFGLVPNLELPAVLSCDVGQGRVRVDEWQQTSVPGTYAVGEAAGVGGLDVALVEGQIAGHVVAGSRDSARVLFPARRDARGFASRLEQAFQLREELRGLARPDTIVCRCEDVRFDKLAPFGGWTEAKLLTRCGMGPCQGRICGAATEVLFGWRRESVRPPVFPMALGGLAPSRA